MAELVDALDSGSSGLRPWGFKSPLSHFFILVLADYSCCQSTITKKVQICCGGKNRIPPLQVISVMKIEGGLTFMSEHLRVFFKTSPGATPFSCLNCSMHVHCSFLFNRFPCSFRHSLPHCPEKKLGLWETF